MKVKHTNITNEILHHLKRNILDGTWKPGEKIDTEVTLAQELSVGRSSVHYAIQRLVSIGVLESYQGKGIYVSNISDHEQRERLSSLTGSMNLRKIMEFRLVLESEICKRVTPYISDETLAEMEECIKLMEASKTSAKPFLSHDMHFHKLLVASTHNDIVIQSFEHICAETIQQSIPYATYGDNTAAILHHKKILDCLKKRNPSLAKQAMIDHLYETRCNPPFDSSVPLDEVPLFTLLSN